jgi:cell division protein FtsI (penicillin-binding protein 3)
LVRVKTRGGRPGELQQRLGSTTSTIRRARRQVKSERTERALRTRDRTRPVKKSESQERPGRWRIRLVGGLIVGFAGVVLVRAAQLQLIEGARYGEAAERQATMSSRVNAKRGVIQDRHGAELAITVDVDSVYAEPRRIEDPAGAAKRLAPILSLDERKLLGKLSNERAFTYLVRRVDAGTAEKVRALKLRGVGIMQEPKRFYSNIDLASHVLGFTSWEGEGKAGIERIFDGELRGKSYEVPTLRDALGNQVMARGFVPHSVLEGADVQLTIDRAIQHAAEEALEEAVSVNQAKAGVAIVMDPYNGDVLAMASYPTFNPNNLGKSKPEDRLNRAVSAVYEPGSTLKMVTIAAALELGLLTPNTSIDCEGGKWTVGGRTIGDADHQFDRLTITEIMKVSSNICAAKIGLMLGRDRLHQALVEFGFAEPTGIELPGELRGLIRPASEWREIELANIAFGQGVAVTPLQIAQSAAVIANGGDLVRPRLVKAIAEKTGEVTSPDRPKKQRVLSRKTASLVARMMIEVTKDGGTAVAAQVPGFAVAGKTGTAQKIDPMTRAYSHELHTSSFVGFVPADRPEVVILVIVDEPSNGSYYGGTVAAPAFKTIALAALTAREVFPESKEAKARFLESHREADVSPPPAALVEEVGDSKPLEFEDKVQEPVGIDTALSPSAQELLGLEEIRPPPRPASGKGGMPDFAGLELHEVLHRSAEIRCDPVVVGTGRVVSQSPRAGSKIEPGSKCELRLQPDR